MSIHLPDMVWAIINFLILVAILNKFLYKPVTKMLDERKKEVVSNLDRAEAAKLEAEKLKDEYASHLQNARKEAQEIIAKANKLGEETKNEIVAQAKSEAEKISAKAQEEIKLEKNKALAELRDEVASLAIMAAEKIISKNIDNKDQEKMVKDFVKEVGEIQ
ncbi:MAG: F-type H+-transporting ATPase subunit b [Clostridia bacterium]|jgi:F-type H+-transporting ATPase subunit b|nr:F-type H+-transporting ATPase subunit b [Clostridia bacterium]MDN5323437.1 F-type H+-transporting ATPase subunit b [Clostridia bacterium]